MLQELGSVKKELDTALKQMEDLDAKLKISSDTANNDYLVKMYEKMTGISLRMSDDEKLHLRVGQNHMAVVEKDGEYLFDPIEVISSDLTEQLKISQENISDFISFLKSQQ